MRGFILIRGTRGGYILREFVYELPSSWPSARVEGGSGLQSMTPDMENPGDSRDSRDPRIVPGGLLLSNTHTLSAYWQVQDYQNDKKTLVKPSFWG